MIKSVASVIMSRRVNMIPCDMKHHEWMIALQAAYLSIRRENNSW